MKIKPGQSDPHFYAKQLKKIVFTPLMSRRWSFSGCKLNCSGSILLEMYLELADIRPNYTSATHPYIVVGNVLNGTFIL